MPLFMLFFIFLFSCESVFSQEYYRWTDENGTAHFSETPPPASLEIQLDLKVIKQQITSSETTSPEIPEVPDTPLSAEKTEHTKSIQTASEINLVSPKNDETIRNNQGNILIQFSTNKPLDKDQYIQLLFDGKKVDAQQGNAFILKNINRGEHSLKGQLMRNEKIIDSTKKITIFLHRATQRQGSYK